MGEEEIYALEGDAETDFYSEEGVGGGLFEDGEGVVEVKFFVYDGGGVDLDAVVGEGSFLFGEEFGGGGRGGEVQEGEDGEEEGGASFD